MKIGIKILGPNYIQKNCLIFIVLSFFYLLVLNSISLKIDLMNPVNLKLLVLSNLEVLFFCFVVFYSILKMIKFSKHLLLLFMFYVSLKIFFLFFEELNKASVILNFVYVFLGICFYLLLDVELALAVFSPGFSQFDIDKKTIHGLNALVLLENDLQVPCNISNLDSVGCCLIFDKENFTKVINKKIVNLECKLENVTFKNKAKQVTLYDLSFGFEFQKDNSISLNWPALYKICRERNIFQ